MLSSFRSFVLAAAMVASAGCDASNLIVPYVPPPVDEPKPVYMFLVGDTSSLMPGLTKQYQCWVKYDKGEDKRCPPSTTWTASAPTVVTVTASGIVTAIGPGQAQIVVTLDGLSATANVTVLAPPVNPVLEAYNQLSNTEKDLVEGFVASNRALVRADLSQPKILWIGPGFSAESVAMALQEVEGRLGAKFVLINDSLLASHKVYRDSTVTGTASDGSKTCAWGSFGNVVNNVPTTGRVRVRPDPDCSAWEGLAHELTHTLGFMGHASAGTDIMSEKPVNKRNANLDKAFQFGFWVAPAGWKVPVRP